MTNANGTRNASGWGGLDRKGHEHDRDEAQESAGVGFWSGDRLFCWERPAFAQTKELSEKIGPAF